MKTSNSTSDPVVTPEGEIGTVAEDAFKHPIPGRDEQDDDDMTDPHVD